MTENTPTPPNTPTTAIQPLRASPYFPAPPPLDPPPPPATPEEAKARRRARMIELCRDLQYMLDEPYCASDLIRQATTLNQLFYAVLRRNIDRDVENGDFDERYINLALRIQKHSSDAYRTDVTLEYMQNMSRLTYENNALPTPRSVYERNEGNP